MKMFHPPWHYVLILAVVLLMAGMTATADEWVPAKSLRIITNIRIVDVPCGKFGINGCLAPIGQRLYEIQVRQALSLKCQTHVTLHEVKHWTHDHDARSGTFMTDDGHGNLMECGRDG